jgi:spore coat protein U-like protein
MHHHVTTSAFALIAATILVAAPASAAVETTTIPVSATVTENCVVAATPVAFGAVNTLSGANVDAAGSVEVTCTNETGWSASAGLGDGSGASFGVRKMTAGANLLEYSLYTDSSRSAVWGDGSGATATVDNVGTGVVQTFPVYGRVGAGQTSVPAGSYADTVLVTITY